MPLPASSAVDQPAVGRATRLHHCLRERRMAVDDARDLRVAALEIAHIDELLDQLRRARADDVSAEELAVVGLADELHESRTVAVDRAATDRAVRHLADDHVIALLSRLRLGEAERADVRRAESRARDV